MKEGQSTVPAGSEGDGEGGEPPASQYSGTSLLTITSINFHEQEFLFSTI